MYSNITPGYGTAIDLYGSRWLRPHWPLHLSNLMVHLLKDSRNTAKNRLPEENGKAWLVEDQLVIAFHMKTNLDYSAVHNHRKVVHPSPCSDTNMEYNRFKPLERQPSPWPLWKIQETYSPSGWKCVSGDGTPEHWLFIENSNWLICSVSVITA